jgi:predicted metal-binding transcription factor (methanogenesis marker protein 9)
MKYKDIIEQELKRIGFETTSYSQEEFDKIANAYNSIGSENYTEEQIYESIRRLENEKICLVQNIILNKKVISADVFFMSVKDISKEILDNLLLSDMKVNISPINQDLSNVSIEFFAIIDKIGKEEIVEIVEKVAK